MKGIGNLLYGILGIGLILFALYNMFGFSERNVIGSGFAGLTLGIFLIWVSLKKDKKTTSEKFIEIEDFEIPIWWKRLIGFIIDNVIILIIYSITITLISQFFEVRLDKLYSPIVIMAPFYVFYYSIQEYLFNTSIGKVIFKLSVVSALTSDKPTLTQIVIRSFTRLIPIDIFFFFTKRPIGLHDIVSKTVVLIKD